MNAALSAPLACVVLLLAAPRQEASDADWKLGVTVDPLRPVSIERPGATPRVVWYATITLKNDTGATRTPTVVAKLVTDTEKTCAAGFDPAALAAVQKAAGDATPLYDWKDPLENGASKKVFVFFGDVDRYANFLEVRLAGVASALSRNRNEWFEQQVEHRTKFHRPGSENRTTDHPVVFVSSEWVVLSKKKIR